MHDALALSVLQDEKAALSDDYMARSQDFQKRLREFKRMDKVFIRKLDNLQAQLGERTNDNNRLILEMAERAEKKARTLIEEQPISGDDKRVKFDNLAALADHSHAIQGSAA